MDDIDAEIGPFRDLEDDNNSDSPSITGERKPKLPLVDPIFPETKRESGFHRTTRMCLEHIREAMLHHRWQEAAEYMACYPQVLEETSEGFTRPYKELTWRLGTEILHHLPNSKLQDYNNVYERMKHSSFKLYLKISLEHSFHLMLHGHIGDARRQLSAAESWRYGKETTVQYQKIKLLQAYRSLLDYIIWCDRKFTLSSSGHVQELNSSDNKELYSYFRQASTIFKEILKNPGVWDCFILSYVEMLEFYEDHDEALNVLNNYAYDSAFPPNPNAHVYLYQHLKRHEAPEKKLMKVLKILRVLVPSHELMLEYSSMLLRSEKNSDVQKALAVLLDMLDFSCWRNNLDVWNRLQAVVQKLQRNGDGQTVVAEHMSGRKGWWPSLHYSRFQARNDPEENPQLFTVKASLTGVLCPDLPLMYGAAGAPDAEMT